MPRSRIPKPYTELTPEERIIYRRIWKAVEKHVGVMEDVDNFIVTLAAQKLNEAAEAAQRIRESEENEGLPIQRYPNGTAQVSPDYTIRKAATMDAAKLLRDAGLIPTERLKLKEADMDADKKVDPMAVLLGLIPEEEEGKSKNSTIN
jgi:phage terminase small subunit